MHLQQLFRVRLRRAARLSTQLAELFEFLGFDFLAQLFRALFFAALLALLLVELFARAVLQLTLFGWRFFVVRFQRVFRALFGVLLSSLAALVAISEPLNAHLTYFDSLKALGCAF